MQNSWLGSDFPVGDSVLEVGLAPESNTELLMRLEGWQIFHLRQYLLLKGKKKKKTQLRRSSFRRVRNFGSEKLSEALQSQHFFASTFLLPRLLSVARLQ
jgi:hypothetical protein